MKKTAAFLGILSAILLVAVFILVSKIAVIGKNFVFFHPANQKLIASDNKRLVSGLISDLVMDEKSASKVIISLKESRMAEGASYIHNAGVNGLEKGTFWCEEPEIKYGFAVVKFGVDSQKIAKTSGNSNFQKSMNGVFLQCLAYALNGNAHTKEDIAGFLTESDFAGKYMREEIVKFSKN